MTELGLELTSQFSVSIFSRQDIRYRENYLFGGGREVIIWWRRIFQSHRDSDFCTFQLSFISILVYPAKVLKKLV